MPASPQIPLKPDLGQVFSTVEFLLVQLIGFDLFLDPTGFGDFILQVSINDDRITPQSDLLFEITDPNG
jgi:hypothetical protein